MERIGELKSGDFLTIDLFGKEKRVEVFSTGDNQFDENGDYKEDGFALDDKELECLDWFIKNVNIADYKKEILKLNQVLYHAGDYTIQRNIYGNYSINIKPELCFCCGIDKKEIVHLSDSEIWQQISAL